MLVQTLKNSLQSINRSPLDFSTDILIIGGSYAGLSALVALKNHFIERASPQKLKVTMIEPRAGLLNILGIPRSIVDTEFAKTQYIQFQNLNDIRFDCLVSNDKYVLENLGQHISPDNNNFIEITFVQGVVTGFNESEAEYHLNGDSRNICKINYDYVVAACGRNRSWPTSPVAYNYESYMKEMVEFNENVEKCNIVTVVGAGAVGIEIAGDVKTKYPEKVVNLIHPHDSFPPEPLTEKFREAIRDSLERAKVNVMTGLRVKKTGDLKRIEFTTGGSIKTDFTYWCTSFQNNTNIFADSFESFVSPKNNIYVNEYLQLFHPENHHLVKNVFCIGDLVEVPIIKSAGWALYMGRQVANNLTSLIFDDHLIEAFPDLTQMPRGMVLVAGNGEIVSELTGEVEVNHQGYVEEYKDYCIGKIRATLGA